MEIDEKAKKNILLIAGVVGAVVGVMQLTRTNRAPNTSVVPIASDSNAVMSKEKELDRQALLSAATIQAGTTELSFDFGSSVADRIANSAYESNQSIPVTAIMFGGYNSGQQTRAVQTASNTKTGTSFGSLGDIPFGSIGAAPVTANAVGGAIDGVTNLVKGLFGGGGSKGFKPSVKMVNALAAANQNVTNQVRATDSSRVSLAEQSRNLKFKGNQDALKQVLAAFASSVPGGTVPTP